MIPRKPFWPRVLRGQPIHFYAADTYGESLRARALRRVLPDAYGIVDMAYDRDALVRGELVFRKLHVVFASGLEATIDEETPPLEADVQTRLYGLTSSIGVYLAVPKLVLDGLNLTPDDTSARSTRYVGNVDAELPWMRPKLEIVFDDYPRDRCDRSEVIALGRVQRAGSAIEFAGAVWPTVLHARACDALIGTVKAVVDALARRRSELLELRSMAPFHLTAATLPQQALDLLVIVSRELAVLRALLGRASTTPYTFYERLQSLYLALVSFEPEVEQPPLYKHDELGTIFPWCATRIVRLLDAVARDDVTALPFACLDQRGLFALQFRREDLLHKRPVLVATCDNDDYLEHLPRLIKLAAPFAIEECMERSFTGVRIDRVLDPPRELPQGRGIAAYKILERERDPDRRPYWQDIVTCREARVFLPHGAPPTLKLFLYGIDRDAWI
ncbi:type VI secretion system baseplate subunit TssK [Pendulispora albinea]|uniref:Type VI secretion system baseplate subunit TssK n=1 Tax=Pendulispora albinea TaxID=2741071 RepID=A0ABZ2M6G6_9BACT